LRYARGDLNEAVEQFLAAVELQPERPEALLYLGYAYAQRGDAMQAEQAFREAIELDPSVPEAYVSLASACYVQADTDGAAAALEAALRSCPQAAATHMRVAEAYYLCNRPVEAEQQYREALRLEPDNAFAHYGLGRNLFDVGQLSEARAELEKAMDLGLEIAAVHYYVGLTYLHSPSTPENQRQAAERFQHALRLDPGVGRAYDCLGQLALREDDFEKARGYYETAVRLMPNLPDPHYGLSLAYRQLGRPEDAERESATFGRISDRERTRERLLRAVVDRPRDPEAHLALGRFYLEDGDYASATRELQAAEALAPDNVEVHRLLERVYAKMGRTEDAQRQAECLAQLEASP
ncbi:MAG: tetratricopeptide repeat protein, partial [Armatimonadota bacterium]